MFTVVLGIPWGKALHDKVELWKHDFTTWEQKGDTLLDCLSRNDLPLRIQVCGSVPFQETSLYWYWKVHLSIQFVPGYWPSSHVSGLIWFFDHLGWKQEAEILHAVHLGDKPLSNPHKDGVQFLRDQEQNPAVYIKQVSSAPYVECNLLTLQLSMQHSPRPVQGGIILEVMIANRIRVVGKFLESCTRKRVLNVLIFTKSCYVKVWKEWLKQLHPIVLTTCNLSIRMYSARKSTETVDYLFLDEWDLQHYQSYSQSKSKSESLFSSLSGIQVQRGKFFFMQEKWFNGLPTCGQNRRESRNKHGHNMLTQIWKHWYGDPLCLRFLTLYKSCRNQPTDVSEYKFGFKVCTWRWNDLEWKGYEKLTKQMIVKLEQMEQKGNRLDWNEMKIWAQKLMDACTCLGQNVVVNDPSYLSLEHVKVENDSSDSCPICVQKLFQPVTTRCKHHFCYECLKRWFQVRKTCPLCRSSRNMSSVARLETQTEVHFSSKLKGFTKYLGSYPFQTRDRILVLVPNQRDTSYLHFSKPNLVCVSMEDQNFHIREVLQTFLPNFVFLLGMEWLNQSHCILFELASYSLACKRGNYPIFIQLHVMKKSCEYSVYQKALNKYMEDWTIQDWIQVLS